MAGGYTCLNNTQQPCKDNISNGEAVEDNLQPLRTVDGQANTTSIPPDLSLTSPDLTVTPSDPLLPCDVISVFVVTFDPKEGMWFGLVCICFSILIRG